MRNKVEAISMYTYVYMGDTPEKNGHCQDGLNFRLKYRRIGKGEKCYTRKDEWALKEEMGALTAMWRSLPECDVDFECPLL